jgi:hypothetical protein
MGFHWDSLMTKKRNLILLNLLLTGTTLLLFHHLNSQRIQFWASHNLSNLNPRPEGSTVAPNSAAKPVPVTSYVAIVDNNLFAIDRNNVIPPEPQSFVINRPKPILTGILGFGGKDLALMLPADAKDSRDYRQLKIGDTIDGYTLVKFLDQKVTMSVGGKELEIPLSEPAKLVARELAVTTPSQPATGSGNAARVTTIGPGADSTGSTAANVPNPPPQASRDQAPVGTVVNGKVKRSIPSPFGPFTIYTRDK